MQKPKINLQDQHQFTLRGADWFWIAGIEKNECFTMLTVEPGADIVPYHARQVVVLPPAGGRDWLALTKSQTEILSPLPPGSLEHQLLRKNGVVLQ